MRDFRRHMLQCGLTLSERASSYFNALEQMLAKRLGLPEFGVMVIRSRCTSAIIGVPQSAFIYGLLYNSYHPKSILIVVMTELEIPESLFPINTYVMNLCNYPICR